MFWNLITCFLCTNALIDNKYCGGCKIPDTSGRKKIVIDTDAGSDDAVAIFLALAVPEVEVVAITCSYGNTWEQNTEKNVLKILTYANRSDIPVYGGAREPFSEPFNASIYFGSDGLGDKPFDRPIIGSINRSLTAAEALNELAIKYQDELTVVVLGPTTNVAKAITYDPDFVVNIKKLIIMGSWINNTDFSKKEYNFGLDPESNEVVLSTAEASKTLILPRDTYYRRKIEKGWRRKDFGKIDTDIVRFLNKIEEIVLENKDEHWSDSDELTVALAIWPELITSSVQGFMKGIVEEPNRSAVIFGSKPNVEVVLDFDLEGFKKKLIEYFSKLK